MQIIEIAALPNGGHRNLTSEFLNIPDGWAKVLETLTLENFPFGEVKTEKINGVMTVTKWIPGTIPESETPAPTPTEMERLRADVEFIAIMTGVEL